MKVCVAKLSELHLKLYESSSLAFLPLLRQIGMYDKGQKFLYSIDQIETLNGSHRQKTYYIYDIKTNGYLFGVDEKKFHKYFIDLEDYRENTIKELLK